MMTTEHVGFNILGFVGVVEDRMDPEKLGRVRVRALGFHTETKCGDDAGAAGGGGDGTPFTDSSEQQTVPIGSSGSTASGACIDTNQLPWAVPAIPNIYGSMNGIGVSSVGLLEGTWVFGVFLDGGHAQQPVILGVLPGRPECAISKGIDEETSDNCNDLSIQSEGFFDPRKSSDLKKAPRPPKCLSLKKRCDGGYSPPSDGGGSGTTAPDPNANYAGANGIEIVSRNGDIFTLRDPGDGIQFELDVEGAINAGYVVPEDGGGDPPGDGGEDCPLSFTGYNKQSHNPSQKESDNDCLRRGLGKVSIDIEEADSAENYPLEGKNEYAYRTGTFKLESDMNRLARNENVDKTIVGYKKQNVDNNVPTANFSGISGLDRIPKKCTPSPGPGKPLFEEQEPKDKKSLKTLWDEPPTAYDATYPYNRVKETESGHVEEWDDTPGAERYHRWHRTGTFMEIHPDGTKVEKIVGERYTIILTNDKIHIEANSDITIDKAAKIYVNADNQEGNHFDIEVGSGGCLNVTAPEINLDTGSLNIDAGKLQLNLGSLNVKTTGNTTFDIGADIIWRIVGCWESHIGGNWDSTILGNYDLTISGDMTNSIFGSKCLQEVQKGEYIQRILGNSYVISGGLMTEIGLGNITMNPIDRPNQVVFDIDPTPKCTNESTPPTQTPPDEPDSDHPEAVSGDPIENVDDGQVTNTPAVNNPPANVAKVNSAVRDGSTIENLRAAGATDEQIRSVFSNPERDRPLVEGDALNTNIVD